LSSFFLFLLLSSRFPSLSILLIHISTFLPFSLPFLPTLFLLSSSPISLPFSLLPLTTIFPLPFPFFLCLHTFDYIISLFLLSSNFPFPFPIVTIHSLLAFLSSFCLPICYLISFCPMLRIFTFWWRHGFELGLLW
jgi:hypothetical protein